VLRQAIPGCQTLEKVSDHEFKTTVSTRIGPMQANFAGNVTLSDLDPPRGYKISGSGSGGVAGKVKGAAKVSLAPDPAGTKLSYEAEAAVTGKLAALGARLIDATAKMTANQFFGKFQEIVGKPAEAPAETGARAAKGGIPIAVWIGIAVAILGVAYYLFATH
jgi:uncharacterized protein